MDVTTSSMTVRFLDSTGSLLYESVSNQKRKSSYDAVEDNSGKEDGSKNDKVEEGTVPPATQPPGDGRDGYKGDMEDDQPKKKEAEAPKQRTLPKSILYKVFTAVGGELPSEAVAVLSGFIAGVLLLTIVLTLSTWGTTRIPPRASGRASRGKPYHRTGVEDVEEGREDGEDDSTGGGSPAVTAAATAAGTPAAKTPYSALNAAVKPDGIKKTVGSAPQPSQQHPAGAFRVVAESSVEDESYMSDSIKSDSFNTALNSSRSVVFAPGGNKFPSFAEYLPGEKVVYAPAPLRTTSPWSWTGSMKPSLQTERNPKPMAVGEDRNVVRNKYVTRGEMVIAFLFRLFPFSFVFSRNLHYAMTVGLRGLAGL